MDEIMDMWLKLYAKERGKLECDRAKYTKEQAQGFEEEIEARYKRIFACLERNAELERELNKLKEVAQCL